MRSAQSRLAVVTSLGSARRAASDCVDALPVSLNALKVGGVAVGGLAGAVLLRGLFTASRCKAKAAASKALAAPPSRTPLGSYLLSETVLTLLLPLCRRFFLGEQGSAGGLMNRLLRNGR